MKRQRLSMKLLWRFLMDSTARDKILAKDFLVALETMLEAKNRAPKVPTKLVSKVLEIDGRYVETKVSVPV